MSMSSPSTTTASDLDVLRARVAEELAGRLPQHLERLSWDADRLADHQRQRLRALLAHALERSPFHARRLRGIDADRFEVADLEQVPVMTKAEMMASFDEVVTDRRLGRRVVEEHLSRSAVEPSLLLEAYVCLVSGGCSGLRGVFVQTVGEYADFVASINRRGMARMIAGGGPPPEGMLFAMVAAASPVHSTGFGAAAAGPPVRVVSAPATLPLAELVERLNALQPPAVMGYATTLAQLAREQQAGRLRIAPAIVTATAELLSAEDRASIRAAFGVPVIDQFAATEGLVGHTEPDGSVFSFASDMCIVELVDADNQPVQPGAASAKALVTNLHNLTQPLIRYELTDRLIRHPDAPDHGHLRATAEGRADDTFRYGSVEVHPLAIRTVMVKSPSVREYEVRQTESGAEVAVVLDRELDRHGPRRGPRAEPAQRRRSRTARDRARSRPHPPPRPDRQGQALHLTPTALTTALRTTAERDGRMTPDHRLGFRPQRAWSGGHSVCCGPERRRRAADRAARGWS